MRAIRAAVGCVGFAVGGLIALAIAVVVGLLMLRTALSVGTGNPIGRFNMADQPTEVMVVGGAFLVAGICFACGYIQWSGISHSEYHSDQPPWWNWKRWRR